MEGLNEELLITINGKVSSQLKSLDIPNDVWERSKDLSFICVFHWLDCFYKDFLNGKSTEEMPCTSCPKAADCKTSPLETFNLASQILGVEMKNIKPKKIKN